jgi:protein-S-isoprenylcysteine O-methyltransferase Ste14
VIQYPIEQGGYDPVVSYDPWIVRTGRWLTKRRGVLFTPLFAVALLAARPSATQWLEWVEDLVGMLCVIGGAWLRLTAAQYHESSHHSQPITAGPYAWVRHPLYLANFLLGLGIVLIAGWWPMVVVYILMFLPIHILIAWAEEEHLIKLYGEKYEAYRKAVPAFLPRHPYRGPRYGSRSTFKLKKGHEGLKVIGYAAGVGALLAFKHWRSVVQWPVYRLAPSFALRFLSGVIFLLAVILRPRIRWAWMRGCQTVIAVACVLLLVIHLPGVLPTPSMPGSLQLAQPPIGLPSLPAVESSSSTEIEALDMIHAKIEDHTVGVCDSHRPVGLWKGVARFLWNHWDVAGGMATFGIASLVEKELEEHRGREFKLEHDLNEAGRVALAAAIAFSVFKQWQRPHGGSLVSANEDSWKFQFRPALDQGRVALIATLKRRF